jgi:hypothetical protein
MEETQFVVNPLFFCSMCWVFKIRIFQPQSLLRKDTSSLCSTQNHLKAYNSFKFLSTQNYGLETRFSLNWTKVKLFLVQSTTETESVHPEQMEGTHQ